MLWRKTLAGMCVVTADKPEATSWWSAGSQDQLMFLNSRGTGPSKKEIVEAHPRWLRKQHLKIVRVSKIHDMMAKCGAA